jgi:hypothetical protein
MDNLQLLRPVTIAEHGHFKDRLLRPYRSVVLERHFQICQNLAGDVLD